ncbi:hypothetical protein PAHA111176_08220 [Parendozoicomonas haliclonae]|uniref:Uncharacterized protein n=1 Tax=Parendozoicomonas haliclonae TaxID=1960125 RepID=A0A1X7AEB0_9GAMM|nr:hypothetical protein EHSB41UT_00287 [Parendozoicomonas haliclonae]
MSPVEWCKAQFKRASLDARIKDKENYRRLLVFWGGKTN